MERWMISYMRHELPRTHRIKWRYTVDDESLHVASINMHILK